jgi:hypothetical protein
MARLQSHISTSITMGLMYGAVGVLFLDTKPEHAVLAVTIFALAGVLPNIDVKNDAVARELTGLLSAAIPVTLIQYFPIFQRGGVPRAALVVIISYLTTRFIMNMVIERYAVHRGMMHSVPAAIITSEIVYLLLRGMFWFDRLYIAFAAFVGFMLHLLMDGYGNIDIVNKALGKAEKKPRAIKFFAKTWGSTATIYSVIAVLGWLIASDLAPQLKFFAGVAY